MRQVSLQQPLKAGPDPQPHKSPRIQRLSRRRFGWEVTLLFGSAERALIFCSANNPSESVPLSDIATQTGEGFYGRRSRRKLILYCFQTNFYE
jgi:hypothetical protein